MIREHGEQAAATWMGLVLGEADALCGQRADPNAIAMWGRMVLQNFGHRSVESLLLAIRDGLNRKVYGALTWPQIAEWLSDHEAKVVALAEGETAQHRFTGDNLGADYLDRLEYQGDGAKIKRQSEHIARLEAKLRVKG